MPNGRSRPVEQPRIVVLGYRAKNDGEKINSEDNALVAFDESLQADFERVILEIFEHENEEKTGRCASVGR